MQDQEDAKLDKARSDWHSREPGQGRNSSTWNFEGAHIKPEAKIHIFFLASAFNCENAQGRT